MREPTQYGSRTPVSQAREPRRRYFLAFEGENTERIYFSGIRTYADILGISDSIEIVPIRRHYKDRSKSHPWHVCQSLIHHLEEHQSGDMTAEQIRAFCADWIMEQKHVPRDTDADGLLREAFKNHGIEDNDRHTPQKLLDACICDVLSEILPDPEALIESFHSYLVQECSFKVKDGDVACIIVDRDSGSVTNEQYDEMLLLSKEKNIRPYITNPRFEFWILLHFIGKDEIDTTNILEKRKKGEEAALEKEIHKHFKEFSKSSVPFDKLYDKVSQAIIHERAFCEDVAKLSSSIGCNIGLLISEMQQKKV